MKVKVTSSCLPVGRASYPSGLVLLSRPLREPHVLHITLYVPYILESNPHRFYNFRGQKNQMRIRIACGLDSRSWAGFWKNYRAAVRAVRTIQYNNLLFYLLFIIYYIIFIIYYSSDSPSSLITESVCLVGKEWLKEKCGLEPRTNFFFFRLRNR